MKCRKIHFLQREREQCLAGTSQGKPTQLRADVLKINVLYLSPHEVPKLYSGIIVLSPGLYKSGAVLAKSQ